MADIMHKAFKSVTPFMQYAFKDGTMAVFVNNLYHTDDINKINELMEEIGDIGLGKSRNPVLYIDENEQEVDPEALTPAAILEKQIRAKILAEMAAASDITNDRGTTDNSGFSASIGNTQSAAQQETKVGVSSAALANLANLQAAKAQAGLNQQLAAADSSATTDGQPV